MWDLFDYFYDNDVYFEMAPIAIINMVCFGNETSVLNCSFSVSDQFFYWWWYIDYSLVVSCQGTLISFYYYNLHFKSINIII